MVFKFKVESPGLRLRVRVFCGKDKENLETVGTLMLTDREWNSLTRVIRNGLGPVDGWVIEED